jgi:hypothetical protein
LLAKNHPGAACPKNQHPCVENKTC